MLCLETKTDLVHVFFSLEMAVTSTLMQGTKAMYQLWFRSTGLADQSTDAKDMLMQNLTSFIRVS